MKTDYASGDDTYELDEDNLNHGFIPILNTNGSDLSLSTINSLSSLSPAREVNWCLTCLKSIGPCQECYQWQYRNKSGNK